MASRGKRMLSMALEQLSKATECQNNDSLPSHELSNTSSDLNESEKCVVEQIEQLYGENILSDNSILQADQSIYPSNALEKNQGHYLSPKTGSLKKNDCEVSIETDSESIFNGSFSDDDPTYLPSSSGSSPHFNQNRDLITVEFSNENVAPVIAPMVAPKTRIRLQQSRKHVYNSSTVVARILEDVLDVVWKANCKSRFMEKKFGQKKRAEGLPYFTKKKRRDPKVPKSIDCSKCMYKCTNILTENDRAKICRLYWNFDFTAKKNFLLAHVVVKKPKRVTVDRKRPTKRSYTKTCYFDVGLERKQVCQNFFCKTLNISPSVIVVAVQKRNDLGFYPINNDHRGRHMLSNKTLTEKSEKVIAHIQSFPIMEGHYVRRQYTLKYLRNNLSVTKMYQLYFQKCLEEESEPVSEITYRRIFSTKFNLSFFIPKTDQCLLCTKYARADAQGKIDLKTDYQQPIERKKNCNEEKNKDKERAGKEENFTSATFDLQAILQIPSTDIGTLHYTRKLTIYNLALYESALPNEAYCFTWLEVHGKKGSSEIGTTLFYYLSKCLPSHVTEEVSLFSDTCGGQNRNQFISAILLWAIQKIDHLQIIEHKFLESGHSYMEADSMHSSIESAKKHTAVYSITEWINIFKRARSKETYPQGNKTVTKKPYHVKEFKYHEMKDLKDLAKRIIKNRAFDNKGKPVKWLNSKRIKYMKGETNIYFNYDMSDVFFCFDVTAKNSDQLLTPLSQHRYTTRKRARTSADTTPPVSMEFTFPSELKHLYTHPLHISIAKKKHLVNLCDKGVIPEEYHGWYKSISAENSVDCIPDVAASETSNADSDFE